MAVPMGDDPTTSRLTTECSAVELRNHDVESRTGFAPAYRRVAASRLTSWPPALWCDRRDLHPHLRAGNAGFCFAKSDRMVELRGIEPAIRCLQGSYPAVERQPHTCFRIQFSKNWGEQPGSSRYLRLHKPMCRPLHHTRHGATPQIRTEPVRFTKAVLVLTSMCGVPEERFELPTYSL
jgi:hypothetical protein